MHNHPVEALGGPPHICRGAGDGEKLDASKQVMSLFVMPGALG